MKKIFMLCLLLIGLTSLTVRADNADGAEAFVQQQIQTVLTKLNSNPKRYQNDTNAFYSLINQEVLPYMDFHKMAQIALGKYWRQATPAQRQSFTEVFRDFLVRFYSSNWTQYANATFRILGNTGLDKYGRTDVRVQMNRPGKSPAQLVFSLWKKDGTWKMYDVSFANVSIVLSYRSSFADDIEKIGIDGLIAKVRHMDATH